jgi:ankyrin repeat protein
MEQLLYILLVIEVCGKMNHTLQQQHTNFIGNLDIVKLLLQNGANVEMKDDMGTTCLHNAAFNSHMEIIQ